jgi:hypothetical protein
VKIGLASDSFGDIRALGLALDRLDAAGAERIFFLGGWYSDVDMALARKRNPTPTPPPGDESLEFLHAVTGALASQLGPLHDPVQRLAGRIVRVASRSCPEYTKDESQRKVFEMVGSLICCLVHDKADLSRDDISNATVLFHGNASQPALVQIGPRSFVTPGALRSPGAGDAQPTFALLELDPEAQAMELVVYEAGQGAEVRRERVALGPARGKVTVK